MIELSIFVISSALVICLANVDYGIMDVDGHINCVKYRFFHVNIAVKNYGKFVVNLYQTINRV